MKERMKFAFAAVFLFTLAFFVTAFAGEALAKPKWIAATTPLSGHRIVQTGKDFRKGDYYSISVGVTYRNNRDSGRIITALFDKTLTFNDISIERTYWQKIQKKVTITSSNVNKVEVWPNQTTKLIYNIPLNKVVTPNSDENWAAVNGYIHDRKVQFKSWSHDFQAQSQKVRSRR
jgi:hypothetical protein